MSTQELLQKYFGTADLYKLLKVKKTAQEKDIKKAYYKLSLEVHPDRVPEKEKTEATEKFKLLSKIYQILIDDDKRKLYDERGIIGDDDDFWGASSMADMLNLWRTIFQPLRISDIDEYKRKYVGSELERKDIKTAYTNAKGCITKMMSIVPFLSVDDEPRLKEIVGEMIAAGEVPDYDIFTKEPEQKRARRHKKAERERKDAEKHKAEIEKRSASLEKALQEREAERSQQFGSLMQNLMAKYGNGEDEDDIVDFDKYDKIKKKLNNSRQKKTPVKKSSPAEKLHHVKKGRVHKKNQD